MDEENAQGLPKMRISKKAYVFDVKRKYSVSKTFAVKKKPENAAEDVLQQLRDAFGKKRKVDEKKPLPQAPAKKDSMAATIIKTIIAVLLVLSISGGIFVLLSLGASLPEPPRPPPSGAFSGQFDYSLAEKGILTARGREGNGRVAYFLVSYATKNLSQLNFSINLFAEKPATQAFLLTYERDGADNYPVFRKRLIEAMGRSGVPINEIGIDQLSTLPGGSTVIVPTGYLPKELLGIDSTFDYKKLLSRGVNIVYIGYPFDKRALDRNGGTVPVDHRDLVWSDARPESEEGFRLYDARYVVRPGGGSGLSSGGMVYGSVSVIRSGQGAMLILSQNLNGGWRDDQKNALSPGEAAAEDIARLVREARWLRSITSVGYSASVKEGGAKKATIFTPDFSAEGAWVEFATSAADKNGVQKRTVDVFRIDKGQKGEMTSREGTAVPYFLSGQKTRLNIELKENSSAPLKLFVRMYKEGEQLYEEELELGLTDPTTEKPKDIEVNVQPGAYVIKVEDSRKKVFAATRLDVAGLKVEANETRFAQGRFSFFLSSADQRISPRSMTISLDGKNTRTYTPSSISVSGGKSAVTYDYPFEIKPGNHLFNFTAGGVSTLVTVEYRPPKNLWDDPIVIVLGVVSALIFGASTILRRPEAVRYGLDIPDFPPISTLKIPVKRETVLGIFDSVNAGYSWQWMPLRMDEIKNGFRRLNFNGKPILIGDFNLERLLARLKDEGLVKEELGYFGLSAWEKDSSHSTAYLAAYRILRNVFVNNAVKFSKLDAMDDCDVKAIVGKTEVYLHIMQSPHEEVVHRALATAKRGTTIMVFQTEEERDAFRSKLTSTSKLAVALKMEVNSGQILLLPVKNEISAFLKGLVR